jgi:hypothetical protein
MLTTKPGFAPEIFVTTYIKHIGCNVSTAHQHFEELVKFLTVSNECRELCAPSANLDVAWHDFILCTKDYEEFCQRTFGRTIHHRPSSKPEAVAYGRTRASAEQRFGQLDLYMWPLDTALAGDCSDCKACTDEGTSNELVVDL